MKVNVGKKEYGWALTSEAFHAGAHLAILPLIIAMMPSEELGIWYIFLSIASLAVLCDFGFQANISRYFTYAVVGQQSIRADGLESDCTGSLNIGLMENLYHSSIKIYKLVGLIVAAALLLFGTPYILYITTMDTFYIVSCWFIYASSVFVNSRYVYLKPIMRGCGEIVRAYQCLVLSKVTFLILAAALLLLDFGLLGVSIASLISAVFYRLFLQYYFNRTIKSKLNIATSKPDPEITKIIWKNAKRIGLISLSQYVYYRYIVLISPLFLEFHHVAAIGIAVQVLQAIRNFGESVISVTMPKFSSINISENFNKALSMFYKCLSSAAFLVIGGVVLCNIVYEPFLEFMGKKDAALDQIDLILLSSYFILDLIYKSSTKFISAYNLYPHVLPGIYSAALILVVVPISALITQDLTMMICSLLVIQSAYNFWYWFRYIVMHNIPKYALLENQS